MDPNLQKIMVTQQKLICSDKNCKRIIPVGNVAIRKNNRIKGPEFYHQGCRPK